MQDTGIHCSYRKSLIDDITRNMCFAFSTLKRRCQLIHISVGLCRRVEPRTDGRCTCIHFILARLEGSNVHHERLNPCITCYKGMSFLVRYVLPSKRPASPILRIGMDGTYQDKVLHGYDLESSLFKYRAYQVSIPPSWANILSFWYTFSMQQVSVTLYTLLGSYVKVVQVSGLALLVRWLSQTHRT